MKDLIELANIVTKTKLRNVELLTNDQNDSKIQQFYDMVADSCFQDDDEAAVHFYGEEKDKRTPSYQKLRKSLKDRLVNSLFIIDLKRASYTSRQKAYYECYKDWAAVKILIGKNAYQTAEGMIRQILKVAKKYEFSELLVDIYHTLRLFHGTIIGNFKKYEEYNEAFKQHQEIWIAENRVEECYIDLSIQFINSKADKVDLQKTAQSYVEIISKDMERYDSYQLQLCGWLTRLTEFTVVNDYANTLEVCNQAIQYFEKKQYVASVPLQVFLYQKCICLVQLRHFDQLEGCIEECLSHLEEGRLNWFKLLELRFQYYAHNECYQEAFALLTAVLENKKFGQLPGNIQETWMISEAYLIFLKRAGILEVEDKKAIKKSNFRLAKFLNEIEIFSKDKQGMNVSVLMIEFLIKLVSKQYDDLIDRAEAINKYRSRYLQHDPMIRSNLFLQMLLQLPKNAFQKEAVAEKTKSYFNQLTSIPIETANQTHEIEIIPYEKLWAIVLTLLE